VTVDPDIEMRVLEIFNPMAYEEITAMLLKRDISFYHGIVKTYVSESIAPSLSLKILNCSNSHISGNTELGTHYNHPLKH